MRPKEVRGIRASDVNQNVSEPVDFVTDLGEKALHQNHRHRCHLQFEGIECYFDQKVSRALLNCVVFGSDTPPDVPGVQLKEWLFPEGRAES